MAEEKAKEPTKEELVKEAESLGIEVSEDVTVEKLKMGIENAKRDKAAEEQKAADAKENKKAKKDREAEIEKRRNAPPKKQADEEKPVTVKVPKGFPPQIVVNRHLYTVAKLTVANAAKLLEEAEQRQAAANNEVEQLSQLVSKK